MSYKIQNTYYKEAIPLLIAVDCIIFGFSKDRLKLLLFKRKIEPFKQEWSLIGSFIKPEESVSEAAKRVLFECTGLLGVFMKQLGCYGEVDRDHGGRVLSIAHYALITLREEEELSVENYQAHWFDVEDIPPLILDHAAMVDEALVKLRTNAQNQPIGFELLPEKFTIPQLQVLYEAIYKKELDSRNFRKKILAMQILEKLNEKDKSSSKKGAFLYRFDEKRYKDLVKKGFHFEL